MVLPIFMPRGFTPGPKWFWPTIEGVFLVAVAITNPGRIDRRSKEVRAVRISLIAVLVLGAGWATGWLVTDLVRGSTETNAAGPLLTAGGLVLAELIIVFALLYWELDGGGPGRRAHRAPRYPDLAFPQQLNPVVCPPGWRPVFIDYLYLGLTNAFAFSPTDVMPLAHWAKLTMGLQSVTSLVIIGLVIARAVNVLT
jgi:hypothetical protein